MECVFDFPSMLEDMTNPPEAFKSVSGLRSQFVRIQQLAQSVVADAALDQLDTELSHRACAEIRGDLEFAV